MTYLDIVYNNDFEKVQAVQQKGYTVEIPSHAFDTYQPSLGIIAASQPEIVHSATRPGLDLLTSSFQPHAFYTATYPPDQPITAYPPQLIPSFTAMEAAAVQQGHSLANAYLYLHKLSRHLSHAPAVHTAILTALQTYNVARSSTADVYVRVYGLLYTAGAETELWDGFVSFLPPQWQAVEHGEGLELLRALVRSQCERCWVERNGLQPPVNETAMKAVDEPQAVLPKLKTSKQTKSKVVGKVIVVSARVGGPSFVPVKR